MAIVPIQKCSLLNAIRVFSDDIVSGTFSIDFRFAPSICRSIVAETGRDVLWGRAEHEIGYILKLHFRRFLEKNINISNVKIVWQGEDSFQDEEDDAPQFRRSDYRAVYLSEKELGAYGETNRSAQGYFEKFCRFDQSNEEGTHLVCRKMKVNDWDMLMVGILVRSVPLRDSRDLA